jgi:hypothetical protein
VEYQVTRQFAELRRRRSIHGKIFQRSFKCAIHKRVTELLQIGMHVPFGIILHQVDRIDFGNRQPDIHQHAFDRRKPFEANIADEPAVFSKTQVCAREYKIIDLPIEIARYLPGFIQTIDIT